MLDDVYVARKCNVNGQVYGFVQFSNVKDVDKLSKALNNVWFGQFHVVEKVAQFDRIVNEIDGYVGGGSWERESGSRTKQGEGGKNTF